jgi:hypothetical protein
VSDPGEVLSGGPTVPTAAGRAAEQAGEPTTKPKRRPLYPRLLHLQHVHPNGWQRAALGEGAVGAGLLLAMADLASAWAILVVPVAVAAVVKGHDVLQGLLERTPAVPGDDDGAGPAGGPAPAEASRD